MLRITEYIKKSIAGEKSIPFPGKIIIWNYTNVCNLSCKHCYASSMNIKHDEVPINIIRKTIEDFKNLNVKHVVVSGGEPLVRKDIYEIAKILKDKNIVTSLSTNGLLVNDSNILKIKEHFTYVGISIDGTPEVHDEFRGMKGAYEKSMTAIRKCIAAGIKIGIRFTITPENHEQIPYIFELAEKEKIQKIYFSHLVYSGRGNSLTDIQIGNYRKSVNYIIDKSFSYVANNVNIDVVTGNNEVDGVYLLKAFTKRFPEKVVYMKERLLAWGGNQAGVRLLNIGYKGDIKPDPFFFDTVGNIKDGPVSETLKASAMIKLLTEHPRKIEGKCEKCEYLDICNGSSRARSYAITNNYFKEDPSCYI